MADSQPLTHRLNDRVEAVLARAAACHAQGQLEESIALYRAALAREPAHDAAGLNLAVALHQTGELAAALALFADLSRRLPGSPPVAFNHGNALRDAGRLDEAAAAFRRALDLRPAHEPSLRNLALVLRELGDSAAALRLVSQALELAPALPVLWRLVGLCLLDLARPAEAEAAFRRGLELAPSSAAVEVNLATALFLQGKLAAAWRHYDQRWSSGEHGPRPGADCDLEWWNGQPLGQRALLVWGEQGLGDEIMLAGYYPRLLTLTPQCVLACQRRLVGLFRRAFPAAVVIDRHEPAEVRRAVDRCGAQVCAGSLGRWLDPAASAFPRHPAYLAALPQRVAGWRTRLAALGPEPKIGIAWRGGAPGRECRLRAIEPQAWRALAGREAVFVDLQYGSTSAERAALAAALERPVWHFDDVDPLIELEEQAGLAAALDLVVAVTQAGAHLSAALGTPTWILLHRAADWRWYSSDGCAPWYQSARLFRQPRPGAWNEVLAEVAAAFDEAAGKFPAGRRPTVPAPHRGTLPAQADALLGRGGDRR